MSPSVRFKARRKSRTPILFYLSLAFGRAADAGFTSAASSSRVVSSGDFFLADIGTRTAGFLSTFFGIDGFGPAGLGGRFFTGLGFLHARHFAFGRLARL